MNELWMRQDDETSAAWAAFQVFRDMSPGDRSLNAAYRASKGRQKGRASGTWHKWYGHGWKARATAYDRYQDEQRRQQLEERRLRALAEQADLGELLRKKAAVAARALVSVTQRIEHEGKEVRILAVKLKPNEIARLAQVGADLERSALGVPERAVMAIQGAVQVHRTEIDYDQMTDAQLEAIIVAAQALREARTSDDAEQWIMQD